MSKEMIISANVHEKKVAILEDGLVTEFYVERSDENQGVVGNLYKGRVMKVLPGMQSAFVDIGLDRDAFLYVSDFTDFLEEEDEIEVRDSDEERPASQPRVEDRMRRTGPPVPLQQQPRGGIPQPPAAETSAERSVQLEDAVEQLAEIAVERIIPQPVPEEEERLLEGPPTTVDEAEVEAHDAEAIESQATALGETFEVIVAEEDEPADRRGRRGRSRRRGVEPEPPAASRRGVKRSEEEEDGRRVIAGAISTRGRYTEPEPTPEEGDAESAEHYPRWEVESEDADSSFERVTDEDSFREAGEMLKDALVQERIIERTHTAEYSTGEPFPREPEPEWRVGSLSPQFQPEPGFERVVDDSGATAQTSTDADASSAEPTADEQDDRASSPGSAKMRHIGDVLPRSLLDRARARLFGLSSEDSRKKRPAFDDEDRTPADVRAREEAPEETASLSEPEEPEGDDPDDRDASVRERRGRSEFAVRRGGRGRRRRREPHPAGEESGEPSETKAAPAAETPDQPDTAAVAAVTQEAAPADAPVIPERPAREDSYRGRGRRQPRRPLPQHRTEAPPRIEQRRPDRPAAPTISELLHEGQEILVQIAKEPIARKGARITSHIALPGRYLVYMPTVNHVGVSRKIGSELERIRLKRLVAGLRDREAATGGFIVRTACAGHSDQELADDMRYLIRTWGDMRKKMERVKAPALVHRDLDLVQRIIRDHLSDEFAAIRVDNEVEYARLVEFVNRIQPKLVKRVKLYTGGQPILEKYAVQPEIDKAVRPRVWLKSGGYIVINQTEALVAIDVNTGKFVGKSDRLEDTITRTNLEAVKEIVRQIRLRDLGGIIVLDLIDMEERKNRQRVMAALQQELHGDRAPSKILSINDFGLVAITRKRVKQSLERTLCTPCPYCQGAGMVKSAQTMCFEILEQAKSISKEVSRNSDVTLRVSPEVAEAFRSREREVMEEIEAHFGSPVTMESDPNLHREQFDFAIV